MKPKKPTSRYKGGAYAGVLAVPPGVYGKTRAYVLIGEELVDLRFSASPPRIWKSGTRLSFVAQKKTDGGADYLYANPNSVRAGTITALVTEPTDRWPEEAGSVVLRGTLDSRDGRLLRVTAGGTSGEVHLPMAAPEALASGDTLEIRGVVAPGTPPKLYADSATSSLRLIASFRASGNTVAPTPKLGRVATWFLVVCASAVGILAYLRRERMKRLALAEVVPFEE